MNQPGMDMYEALSLAFDTTKRNPALSAILWDEDMQVLTFVPVGAPVLRCVNLWFKEDGEVSVVSNNGPDATEVIVVWSDGYSDPVEQWGLTHRTNEGTTDE